MNTLTGKKQITVTLEPVDGVAKEPFPVEVRQIPIRDYDQGFQCFNDEIALVAFLVGMPRTWALALTPESYEEILAVGTEVNQRGFFAFCRRRIEADLQMKMRAAVHRETMRELEMAEAVLRMPTELRNEIMKAGAQAMGLTPSPESSSPPPRPRA